MTKEEYRAQKEFEERVMEELFRPATPEERLMPKSELVKHFAENAVKLFEGPDKGEVDDGET